MKQPRYSRSIYREVAKIIGRSRGYILRDEMPDIALAQEGLRLTIATHFADLFQQDSPRFNRTHFLIACKGKKQ